jgi:hypothetical protein
LIEKAKIASKNRYVPVDKEAKKALALALPKKEKKITPNKAERCISFFNEMIPLIESRLNPEVYEDCRIPSFDENGWHYYNFRKIVFEEKEKHNEIYISRFNETHQESGWFYYKTPYKLKRSIIIGDWTVQDYTYKKKIKDVL